MLSISGPIWELDVCSTKTEWARLFLITMADPSTAGPVCRPVLDAALAALAQGLAALGPAEVFVVYVV